MNTAFIEIGTIPAMIRTKTIGYLKRDGLEYYFQHRNGIRPIKIPEKANITVLQPVGMPARESLSEAIDRALTDPLDGGAPFSELLQRKNPSSLAIAIPDKSPPVPVNELLSIIFHHLDRGMPGFELAVVTIIIGCGLQPPPDHEAISRMIPSDIIHSCNVLCHDPHNALMKDYGTTRRGTPLRINAAFGEADFKLVVDLIEPHQFFGFAGGLKSAVVGCASAESIRHNHGLMRGRPVGIIIFYYSIHIWCFPLTSFESEFLF